MIEMCRTTMRLIWPSDWPEMTLIVRSAPRIYFHLDRSSPPRPIIQSSDFARAKQRRCTCILFNRYTYFARLSSRIEKFCKVRASNRDTLERKLRGVSILSIGKSVIQHIHCLTNHLLMSLHFSRNASW